MNRGSPWRKWDLHLHSPASYEYGNKSVSAQDMVDELVKAGTEVIAITDHHRIDVKLF